jgi:hypothetical protein
MESEKNKNFIKHIYYMIEDKDPCWEYNCECLLCMIYDKKCKLPKKFLY